MGYDLIHFIATVRRGRARRIVRYAFLGTLHYFCGRDLTPKRARYQVQVHVHIHKSTDKYCEPTLPLLAFSTALPRIYISEGT